MAFVDMGAFAAEGLVDAALVAAEAFPAEDVAFLVDGASLVGEVLAHVAVVFPARAVSAAEAFDAVVVAPDLMV